MPKQTPEDQAIGTAVLSVVLAEMERKGVTMQDLSRRISPNNPNLIRKMRDDGAVPMVSTLVRIGREIGVPASKLLKRAEGLI